MFVLDTPRKKGFAFTMWKVKKILSKGNKKEKKRVLSSMITTKAELK